MSHADDSYRREFTIRQFDYNEHNFHCDRRVWCVREVGGNICAVFTWALIVYAIYVVMFIIVIPMPNWIAKICHAVAFNFLAIMAIICHLRSMLTDPGAVPIASNAAAAQNVVKCSKCGCIKPDKAHHCSICKRCIRKMDHHCPWINNCVGEYNVKYFILFNFYVAAMSCYTFVLCILKIYALVKPTDYQRLMYGVFAFLTIATLEAMVFGIFTISIAVMQLINVISDTTYIEKLQKNSNDGDTFSRYQNFRSVFGGCCLKWFCPCSGGPTFNGGNV